MLNKLCNKKNNKTKIQLFVVNHKYQMVLHNIIYKTKLLNNNIKNKGLCKYIIHNS